MTLTCTRSQNIGCVIGISVVPEFAVIYFREMLCFWLYKYSKFVWKEVRDVLHLNLGHVTKYTFYLSGSHTSLILSPTSSSDASALPLRWR